MTWTLFCRQTNKIVRYNASSHISLLFTNKQTNKIIKKIACKSRIFVFCSRCKHVNCSASSQHKFSYLHDIMIIRNIFIFEPDIWWSQVELELVREPGQRSRYYWSVVSRNWKLARRYKSWLQFRILKPWPVGSTRLFYR